ncbi:kinase-like domain-containing protein [Multifurca ochricompacta]|uniref:Kinase-like domain-containing protein n=1 Tax=Multifurca ochricompacta TaxID=376703 RepID=A0AAD4LWK3_9AGAM|nr:kinase-like domain-containing protein [Multifurca ochricompacta]
MKRMKGEDKDKGKEDDLKEDEVEDELESRMDTIYRICRQLIGYALELHQSQFRVFSFSIFLFGQRGRLLRWDRSGVIYTESFEWLTQPDTLLEFIWRFNFLSVVERGHDSTVTPVTDDEAEVALPKLKRYPGLENTKKADLRRFLVHDDRSADGDLRGYITPNAVWDTGGLFGRSTFGYIAFDVASTNLVYLKDFWRTDLPGIQKESDIYCKLHDAQVPNIPRLGPAGDVPLSPECTATASFATQRTRTQDYLTIPDGEHEWCPGQLHVDPYVHYRLVLETLGKSLSTFKSTRQLCEVIRDAIVAHSAAYERAQILHRDVSAGNILITEEGTGMLIDWDLSKQVHKGVEEGPRQHSRTGTWQFISISRLREPRYTAHEVSDDLESFFWVLLYQIARCRNILKIDVSNDMQEVFDDYIKLSHDRLVRGGRGKLICLIGGNLSPRIVKDLLRTAEGLINVSCTKIIEELRSLFHDYYLHVETQFETSTQTQIDIEEMRRDDSRVKEAQEKLRSPEFVLSIMNKYLASKWDIEDDGSLDKTDMGHDASKSRYRRKRKAEDVNSGEKNSDQVRWGRLPPSSIQPSSDVVSSRSKGTSKTLYSKSSQKSVSSLLK